MYSGAGVLTARHMHALKKENRTHYEMKRFYDISPSVTKVSPSFDVSISVSAQSFPKSRYLKIAVMQSIKAWIQKVQQQLQRDTTYLKAKKYTPTINIVFYIASKR